VRNHDQDADVRPQRLMTARRLSDKATLVASLRDPANRSLRRGIWGERGRAFTNDVRGAARPRQRAEVFLEKVGRNRLKPKL
jgi:hypothetical protein